MGTAAIIVAAGRSSRFGTETPKQFSDLRGRTVVDYSLLVFRGVDFISTLVLVVPEDMVEECRHKYAGLSVVVTAGGKRRRDSVENGLRAISEKRVLIHDGARPAVTTDIILRVNKGLHEADAVIPVIPVVDTVKRIDKDQFIIETVDRTNLRAAQTPQGFATQKLKDLLVKYHEDVTDEALLFEKEGLKTLTVIGDPQNIKITRPEDMDYMKYQFRKKGVQI